MPEVWGGLPKSQTDNERIEDAITRRVGEHAADETAHLLPGQSLQSHKASQIIDHLAESVVNDKLNYLARAYSAIVALDGGDFQDIQEAINYASSRGGGRILLSAGTYVLTKDLYLASHVSIIGAGQRVSIINCNGHTITTRGALPEEDPLWEDWPDNIFLHNIGFRNGPHEMVRIIGVLTFTYCEFSSGAGTLVYDIVGNSQFSHCVFLQPLAWFNANRTALFYGIHAEHSGNNTISYCSFFNIPIAIGVTSGSTVSSIFVEVCSTAIRAIGMDIIISNNQIINALDEGIFINSHGLTVEGNNIIGNLFFGQFSTRDGIRLHLSSRCIMIANRIRRFQFGVRLPSGSDRNLVLTNTLNDNALGAVSNLGTGNIVGNNITA